MAVYRYINIFKETKDSFKEFKGYRIYITHKAYLPPVIGNSQV
ncbi:protein of unknown function (plasmid) [Thermococcus nautili]|nr:protein of unknown function [Thermococcus nautili]